MRHRPGTPLRSYSPRSVNVRRDPVTISRTVDETSTSLGPASADDARTDVHRHARDVVTANRDLARVDADPHLDAEPSDRVDDRLRAVDRHARVGERRDEAVARGVHLEPAEPVEFVADGRVVVVEQVAPAFVAEERPRAPSTRRCR